MEVLCDRVAFLREGRILDIAEPRELRRSRPAVYRVGIRREGQVREKEFRAEHGKLNALFRELKPLDVVYIREEAYGLEQCFNERYKGGNVK